MDSFIADDHVFHRFNMCWYTDDKCCRGCDVAATWFDVKTHIDIVEKKIKELKVCCIVDVDMVAANCWVLK